MNQLTASDARERMRGIDGQLDLLSVWIDAALRNGEHDRAEELLTRHDELMRDRRKWSAVYESGADDA